ncbi:MAG TPA: spermidine/putrescine ABC transporter substrate-binding protein [Kineosporiaceae bacterium]|nr:spermidine/putrescine ABC transporter substrate-binding protein [Kineosporiaceae bacterium]
MTQRRRPKLSPEAAAIVRAQLSSGRAARSMSRRSLLGGAGALGVGAALAACSTGGSNGNTVGPSPAPDRSKTDKVVNWANWSLYLDFDDKTKTYPTLENFQKINGIKATYDEAIEDNDSYYGKIQGQLKNGQDIGKDIVVFTDWMASRMIRQGYAQKLDKSVIPLSSNLLPSLQQPDFDPGRNYSLTWQSGYAGIAWNKEKLPGGLRNVSDLWNPELKGKVEVLSEFRDTLGLIMLEQGVDIEKAFTADEFGKALEVLDENLSSRQIRQVKGNSYKEDLIKGDVIAVIAWSGDITQINFEEGNKWEFAIPEAGGTLWSDNLMVPIGSPHKENAEILMNYYYDPNVAAQVAQYVNYICPVKGAQAAMEKLDPELAEDPFIFPSAEDLAKVKQFRTLTPAEETKYTAQFQSVLGV